MGIGQSEECVCEQEWEGKAQADTSRVQLLSRCRKKLLMGHVDAAELAMGAQLQSAGSRTTCTEMVPQEQMRGVQG